MMTPLDDLERIVRDLDVKRKTAHDDYDNAVIALGAVKNGMWEDAFSAANKCSTGRIYGAVFAAWCDAGEPDY